LKNNSQADAFFPEAVRIIFFATDNRWPEKLAACGSAKKNALLKKITSSLQKYSRSRIVFIR
jgi:hypothetical protein